LKQVLFDRAGSVHVDDVPAPGVSRGEVLVRVAYSVISTGTETMGYAKGGVASEVASNPRLVGRVWEQVQSAGVHGALDQVRDRLAERRPRGYAGSGVVVEVGEGVVDLRPGDRVAYGGQPHGEYVAVPRNLVAPVPDGVPLEQAAVTTLGSIALHGLRLAETSLGETVAVIGLGVVGQLTVGLARAMGLRVAGGDLLASRVALARRLGLQLELDVRDPASAQVALREWTRQIGADAVIVCAGSKSSQPTGLAAELCRDRGSVVVVGASGLELERAPFYRKELRFRISRSYGPGRYDPLYEEKGRDYPVGYVRWTQNRNFEAFLEQLARGALPLAELIEHRIPVDEAARAYALLKEGPDAPVTALLDYGVADEERPAPPRRRVALRAAPAAGRDTLRVALVGCGSFARSRILPALRRASGARVAAIAARTGSSASNVARLARADYCTTDYQEILEDASIDAVVIATRHDLHHPMALAAARAGKPFHVEKPLALTAAQSEEIVDAVEKAGIPAAVGFNRRSAPLTRKLRGWLASRSAPLHLLVRVNAGMLPPDHWTLDAKEGGGRLVGEGCHFVDLAAFLAGQDGRVTGARAVVGPGDPDPESNISLSLSFPDGSLATVVYLSNGHRSLPKERIEASWEGRSVVLDDFRALEAHGLGGSERARVQDKGFADHFENFLAAVRGRAELVAPVTAGLEASRRVEEAQALLGAGPGA